jgi:hypothetical protein
MDEIINLVSQKAGIPTDKAQTAVTTVVNFLKTRLPAPVGSQIDALVAGGGNLGGMTSGLADTAKSIGGMFGGKEERKQP